jgi:hypothetical protein
MENFNMIELNTFKYVNDYVGLNFVESQLDKFKSKKVSKKFYFNTSKKQNS